MAQDAQATPPIDPDRLLADGRVHEAIDLLDRELRATDRPELATKLVDVRHRGFDRLDRSGLPPAPELGPLRPPEPGTIPVVPAADLDVESLRQGLATHGCVWVRGAIDDAQVRELRDGIDRALDAYDEVADGSARDAAPWYVPFVPEVDYEGYSVAGRRRWTRASGALWAADSPAMLARITQIFRDAGLADVIAEHLGERPAISVNKSSLRRVPVDSGGEWHQDGAFLGSEIRTVNVWLALDDCGVDAPGMDVLPARVPEVVPTGTDGAIFDWSVSDATVQRVARDAGVPVIRPEFRAGDLLLFDQFFLHSTAAEPTMGSERHAIECWFFAPSAYPDDQIPLVF